MWYERKKKFIEGIRVVTTKLSDKQFETNFKKAYESFKASNSDLSLLSQLDTNYANELSAEERQLADRTFLYIAQRLNLFLLSPAKLQGDLTDLGFSNEKADLIVKIYSESSREIVKNLQTEESDVNEEVVYVTKMTLADDTSSRCRKPTVRLSLKKKDQELIFENLGRAELGNLFDNFEIIQKELDAISTNKT